jgi:pimeloyl-ACP methyl ester carboxylesterase
VFEVMMRRNVISRERFNALPREMQSFSLLAALDRSELPGEALLTAEEAQVYIDAFSAGGFTGPINWYRNWTHNWASTANVEQRVTVPTLFIEAVDDVIISPEQVEAMKPHVDDLTVRTLQDCGHWSQQEKPAEINEILLDWLRKR